MREPLIRPEPLEPGDTIGIFTPSFPAHVHFRDKYLHGIGQLEALGFRVVEGPLTASRRHEGYRSGTPRERAAEFMALVEDPEVRCLMSTIGGYNSSSMIEHLDFDRIRANPKIICGYSDVTSLHMAVLAYSGLSTFYGPAVMPSFGEWPVVLPETADSFLDAVQRHRTGPRRLEAPARWSNHFRDAKTDAWKTEPRRFKTNSGWRTLNPGSATAPILVANLNTLLAAAGTAHFPDVEAKILLVEDMDAPFTQEERSFRHLEMLGVFDRIAGLMVGKPENLNAMGAPFGYDDLILEVLGPRSYPIVSNVDCGHTNPMLTIAEMTRVKLDADGEYRVSLVVEEPMVAA